MKNYLIALLALVMTAGFAADAHANYLRTSPHHSHRVANSMSRDPAAPYQAPHTSNNAIATKGQSTNFNTVNSTNGQPQAQMMNGNPASANDPNMGTMMNAPAVETPIAQPRTGVYAQPLTMQSEGWGYPAQ